jgi:hypothetical protein
MMGTNGEITEMRMIPTVVNGINTEGLSRKTIYTRGEAKTSISTSFSLSGYSYLENTWGTQAPDYLCFNEIVTQETNGWHFPPLYWPPASKSVRFFAYAPIAASGNGIIPSAQNYIGTPYLDFTVNNSIENQVDLMAAASSPDHWDVGGGAYSGSSIKLPFKHVLTCVKFAEGSGLPSGKKITIIRIRKILSHGKYYIGDHWENGTLASDTTDYGIITSHIIGEGGSEIISSSAAGAKASTLLMIPQTLNGSNQQIEVTITDNDENNSNPKTYIAPLKGQTWYPGTTVTYNLSLAEDDFTDVLQIEPVAIGHNGGDASFTVTSYRQGNGNNGTKTALPWKITGYSIDGGATFTAEKPASCNWVGIMTTSGNGGTAAERGYVKVAEQTAISTFTPDAAGDEAAQIKIMQDKGENGSSENPYDLSMHDMAGNPTQMNTANCYVVNAPGWYKLPLVYGNGIVNGVANTAAYNGSNFLDHAEASITVPEIYNKYIVEGATLVWQDKTNLITKSSISLTDANKYLKFYISPDNIGQGNAIVAVIGNGGKIMWSWHIWVTAMDLLATKRVVNYSRHEYYFMPVVLGWCSTGESTQTTYNERKLIVKVQQSSGKTATFNITQMKSVAFVNSTRGNATYYQWGRKDPILGGTADNVDKTCDVSNSAYTFQADQTTSAGVSIGTSIQNPHVMYCNKTSTDKNNDTRWCITETPTMWNVVAPNVAASVWPSKDERTVKSIYDPCPVGFHVSDALAFTGFTTTGKNITATSEIRKTNDAYNQGYWLYTDGTLNETIFFPSGNRSAETGKVHRIGTHCEFHLANGIGVYFRMNATDLRVYSGSGWRKWGCCVQPIADW